MCVSEMTTFKAAFMILRDAGRPRLTRSAPPAVRAFGGVDLALDEGTQRGSQRRDHGGATTVRMTSADNRNSRPNASHWASRSCGPSSGPVPFGLPFHGRSKVRPGAQMTATATASVTSATVTVACRVQASQLPGKRYAQQFVSR